MSHNLKLTGDTSRCRPHRNRHSQHRTCSIHRPDCRHRLLEWILAQSFPTVSTVTNHHCRSPGLPPPSPRMDPRTKLPDCVNCDQPPLPLAPGCSAEHASDLSETAQFASPMWCCAKKFNHVWVSPRSKWPFPSALHVPHSVANTATPVDKALDTLFLNSPL